MRVSNRTRSRTSSDRPLYVAYYRVSTDKQGERGLGIKAQRDAIEKYLASQPEAELYACFTEVESGTGRGTNRPGLTEALALARQMGATLLIAKLDRLARNVHFITGLIEQKVDFIALDVPWRDKFMIQQMAVFAEFEADRISERTSAAIQTKLTRGENWGFALPSRAGTLAARKAAATEFAQKMKPILEMYLQDSYSLNKIAAEFNRLGYETASGLKGAWTARAVKNCLAWMEAA